MITTLSFSTADLASRAYAISALHNVACDDGSQPPLTLNPDHRDMLNQAAYGSFLELVMDFIPLSIDYAASPEADIFTLDLEIPGRPVGALLRGIQRLAEEALLQKLLALLYSGCREALSDACSTAAQAAVTRIRSLLDLPTAREWY